MSDAIKIIKAARKWPEQKRLVTRFSEEHRVLWRHSPISRGVLESRSSAERWVLLTEWTQAEPVDTDWIYAVPASTGPSHEAIAEAHREEWGRRARAILKARADWKAGHLNRMRVELRYGSSAYRGLLTDPVLVARARAAHDERLQRLASGPFEDLPAESQPVVRMPQRNPFRPPRPARGRRRSYGRGRSF